MENKNSNITISGNALLELIPQREPMVMINTLSRSESEFFTTLTVKSDNLFCENGHLSECGLAENMAQSAAAREGFICHAEGKEIPLGMIGAIEKARFFRLPLSGETITTYIEPVEEIFNIVLLSAVVKAGEEVVAEGKLKIYLKGKE